jgi:hypothetical protein
LLVFVALQQGVKVGGTVLPRTIFDTVRIVSAETTHTVVTDTVGIVAMQPDSTWILIGKVLISVTTLAVGIAAAIAAWKAASAAKASVTAAERQAKAAELEIEATQKSVAIQLEQLTMMREVNVLAREQNATALKSLSQRIRVPLRHLDPQGPRHKQLREYSHLKEDDVRALETLARGVSSSAIKQASMAAIPLRTIDALRQKALSINEQTGWLPSASEQGNWQAALKNADSFLEALEAACDNETAA